MKLFVVQVAGGNITVKSEWEDNPNGAKKAFHKVCEDLWADAQTIKATVKILDEQLDKYEDYVETVLKTEVSEAKKTAKRKESE